ncbi:MAG: sialidase family protein, partial [Bacteroidota bacterium]
AWSNARGNLPATHEIMFADLAINEKAVVYAADHECDWPYIYKSTDGGTTWTNTFLTQNNQNIATGYGAETGIFSFYNTGGFLGFDVADNDPNVLLATNYGMPHLSYDGGTTWRQCYLDSAFQHPAGTQPTAADFYKTTGMNLTSGHYLHWIDQTHIFAACTDIGNQYSEDGGESWTFARNVFEPWQALKDGNWYVMAKHSTSNTLYAANSDLNDIYLEYRLSDDEINGANGKLLTSSDTGQTWTVLHDFGHPVAWFVQDPESPSRMFASVVHYPDGGIFRSENSGVTWTKLTLPARTEGHSYTIRLLGSGDLVATFSGRKDGNGNLTASSGVFYSEDNGNTWSDRSAAGMFYYTKDLTVSPHDPAKNTWFANVWGGLYPTYDSNGGVWRTSNRGLTWTKIFEHKRAESLTVDPLDANAAYLATEYGGLWHTNTLNAATPAFFVAESFPYPRPKRVFFNPYDLNEMWVTTMGGAIWRGERACQSELTLSGNPVPPGTYKAGSCIYSAGVVVAGSVTFDAGSHVSLEAGFEVKLGAEFFATAGEGCQ